MSRRKGKETENEALQERREVLASPAPVAGIPGPGHWLVAEYLPTAPFSLKISLATSSVGKTLVIPTPYSIKMALVDAGFRIGLSDLECDAYLRALRNIDIRISPPRAAVVTHTFVKVRQESRKPGQLFDTSIAYRELAHHHGSWQWAFDISAVSDRIAEMLVKLAPHVSYIGKRGSFIQFNRMFRLLEVGPEFTQPVDDKQVWTQPERAHIAPLDDLGPEADLETLSSFTSKSPKRDKHRLFVNTVIPLGLVNTGPGFSEYRDSKEDKL